jgi:hypothetical protein
MTGPAHNSPKAKTRQIGNGIVSQMAVEVALVR